LNGCQVKRKVMLGKEGSLPSKYQWPPFGSLNLMATIMAPPTWFVQISHKATPIILKEE